jgi:hypothetical protein
VQCSRVLAALSLVLLCASPAVGAKWDRAYIRRLPDSAFAVIEFTPRGRALRRLPHHDALGNLDVPHLCNAIARLGKVKWIHPVNAEIARLHLKEHLAQAGTSACRPTRRTQF